MAELMIEWAGAERRFALSYGGILDLEEACGKVGIGEIYLRLAQHRYFAKDVYHTIRLALMGGGMVSTEAKRLVDDRFGTTPLAQMVNVALEILLSVMEGIQPDETQKPGDPSKPYDAGAIFAAFAKMGVSPQSIREMAYADFVNMCRAFGGDRVQPPTEDEFEDMLRKAGYPTDG